MLWAQRVEEFAQVVRARRRLAIDPACERQGIHIQAASQALLLPWIVDDLFEQLTPRLGLLHQTSLAGTLFVRGNRINNNSKRGPMSIVLSEKIGLLHRLGCCPGSLFHAVRSHSLYNGGIES